MTSARISRRRSSIHRVTHADVRRAIGARGRLPWSGLISHFNPPPHHKSNLKRVVDGLLSSGELTRDRRGYYQLAGDRDVRGVVERRGANLVVVADNGKRRIVRGRCRPGDVVMGEIDDDGFRIYEIVMPSSKPIIGEVVAAGRRMRAESLDPDLKGRIDFVVPCKAREGDLVEVEVVAVTHRGIEGRVTDIIEAGNEADRAATAALRAFDVPTEWPFDPRRIRLPNAPDAASRADLTQLPLVTIDGETARDFDDAVYAEPMPGGGWRLVVAIADVSHYVKPDSPLDREAERRGNSVYLPDRVIPMLPPALSDDLCSLVPHENRLAVACDMTVSADGELLNFAFSEATIRSHERLTYTRVARFLGDGPSDGPSDGGEGDGGESDGEEDDIEDPRIRDSLTALHALYRSLARQRELRGALDLELVEYGVLIEDGNPVGTRANERNDAHRLIEEAMILANVAAARCLEERLAASGGAGPQPAYRVHEPPAKSKLRELERAFRFTGERLPGSDITPAELSDVLNRVREKSSIPQNILDLLVLRCMAQARYEPKRLGHFGLGLPTYVHFTSPIRRYADLLVHRQIKGEAMPNAYHDVCAHISATERRAEAAERMVSNWLKCVLIEDRVGAQFHGTIVSVTGFGLFVELDGTDVQGLLHISDLGNEYFEYVPEAMALVGEYSGMRYRLGDRVTVVLEDVSPATGRVDLLLGGQWRGHRRHGRRGRGRRGRGNGTSR